MSGKTMKEEEDHLTYILKKRDRSISYFESAVKGNGLFTDFDNPNSNKTNFAKDKSTTKQNIKKKRSLYQSKKDRRFPKGRLSQ